MDWIFAIERNRDALKRIVAMLVGMAGLVGGTAFTSPLWGGRWSSDHRVGVSSAPQPPPDASRRPPHKGEVGPAPTLPRHLHRAILRLLRPAESAVRRLVVVAARGLVVELPPLRPRKPKPRPTILRNGVGTGILMPPGSLPPAAPRARALPLLDRLRSPLSLSKGRHQPQSSIPRISFPGSIPPSPIVPRRPPARDDRLDATRLALRLQALGAALDDLPRHARRFARWTARKHAVPTRRIWPLRPGRPPGQRARRSHEIHEILHDLHGLAFDVLERRDSS
jgi:hypothetical protein